MRSVERSRRIKGGEGGESVDTESTDNAFKKTGIQGKEKNRGLS